MMLRLSKKVLSLLIVLGIGSMIIAEPINEPKVLKNLGYGFYPVLTQLTNVYVDKSVTDAKLGCLCQKMSGLCLNA